MPRPSKFANPKVNAISSLSKLKVRQNNIQKCDTLIKPNANVRVPQQFGQTGPAANDNIADVRNFDQTAPMKAPIIVSTFLPALLLFGCSSNIPFDSDKWKGADLRSRDRVDMMGSLLSQHALNGLPRSEVVDLLGEPTPTDKWKEWDMVYVLGPTDPMPIDHEWLVIKLDGTGRVLAFKHTED